MPIATFIGDSFTAGQGASPSSNRFSTLLCSAMGWTENNQGVGSSVIADAQIDKIVAHTTISTDVSVWLAGYNDMRYFGSDAAALADNGQEVRFGCAALAVPAANRVTYNGGSVTYGGSWTNTALLGGLTYSTTSGNTAGFSVTGTTIVIATCRSIGAAGNMTVTVDGSVVQTYSCFRASANSPGTTATPATARTYSGGLIIITGLTNTSHSVVLTNASNNAVFFLWAAGLNGSPTTTVYLGGTVRMPTASYANPSFAPYNVGSDAAADAYIAELRAAVSDLRSAGLDVRFAHTGLNTGTQFDVDLVHPNNAGHASLAKQFQIVSGTTAYAVSGPSSGASGVASTTFTVTAGGSSSFSGLQTVTLTANNGTITATAPSGSISNNGTSAVTITPAASATSFTYTYTPASAGSKTISYTNGQGWTNPTASSYTATSADSSSSSSSSSSSDSSESSSSDSSESSSSDSSASSSSSDDDVDTMYLDANQAANVYPTILVGGVDPGIISRIDQTTYKFVNVRNHRAPVTVTLHNPYENSEIRYTLNGKNPNPSSHLYSAPLVFRQNGSGSASTVIKARIYDRTNNNKKSQIIRLEFRVLR
jgi:lysophospholipase L1-like esterase